VRLVDGVHHPGPEDARLTDSETQVTDGPVEQASARSDDDRTDADRQLVEKPFAVLRRGTASAVVGSP
jgi:hypothetical protein